MTVHVLDADKVRHSFSIWPDDDGRARLSPDDSDAPASAIRRCRTTNGPRLILTTVEPAAAASKAYLRAYIHTACVPKVRRVRAQAKPRAGTGIM